MNHSLDISYTIGLATVWLITLVLHLRKRKCFDLGGFTFLMFFIYSLFSCLLLFNEDYNYEWFGLTLFPFIYLYIAERITLSPLVRLNTQKYNSIKPVNVDIIKIVCYIYVVCSIISLPVIIPNIQQGLTRLLFEQAGYDLYTESTAAREQQIGTGIMNIPAILSGMLSLFCLFFTFYFLTTKKRPKLLITFLGVSVFISLLSQIAEGHRGGIMEWLMQVGCLYFIFLRFYSEKIKRRIRLIGIIAVSIIVFLLGVLTFTRFDNYRGGGGSSIIAYAGMADLAFNRFGLDDNGIRYGDRTASFYKRMIGLDAPKNYYQRRAKYPNLKVNDETFISYVGDFTIDYGPIAAAIILCILTAIMLRLSNCRGPSIGLHNLLAVFFVASVCVSGGMSLFNLADAGALKVFVFIILYIVLKNGSSKIVTEFKE